MPKYMLKRQYPKMMELTGIKNEQRGPVTIKVMVPILFKPMVVVVVPEDVIVDHLVKDGYIVEIKDRPNPVPNPVPELIPVKPVAKPVEKPVEKLPEKKEEEPEVVSAPPVKSKKKKVDLGYEATDAGGFRCVECGKEYKKSPRAEAMVQAHIEKNH